MTSTPLATDNEPTPLMFSAQDLILLGKTADSLSAYLGAAVLAEVGESEGAEWVIFGQVLATDETPDEDVLRVQLGGKMLDYWGEPVGLRFKTNRMTAAIYGQFKSQNTMTSGM